jgi:phosphoglycerate dehydrogenase-like enzyme
MRTGGCQVTVGTGLRGKTLGVLGLGRVGRWLPESDRRLV